MNAITEDSDPAQAELVIGLVNNMPASAFDATHRQFVSLLNAGSAGQRIRMCLFASGPAPQGYEPIESLWRARLDGLVVTGAEPQADSITDEPFWDLLARLVDWAAEHTRAAMWSCLAAHAAVRRLDGVPRRRLSQKLSGVFACHRTSDHALLDDAPTTWPVPHSRYNDVDAGDLEQAGYTILTRGPGRHENDGADAFVKPIGASLFLMLQGHPEYTAETLHREYRRDLRRWHVGGPRPVPPSFYFDSDTEALLATSSDPLMCLDAIKSIPDPAAHWRPHSARLYQNWLAMLNAQSTAQTAISTP